MTMTPEQQREQLLKRILPALGVLVVYFAIISGFITDKSAKAEEQYVQMVSKGINPDAIPGMEQEKSRLKEEVIKLEQETKSIHAAMAAESGFLSLESSTNDAIDRITVILADNHLQVLEETPNEQSIEKNLSRSLQDTQNWLKELLTPEETPDPKAKASAAKKPAATDDKNAKDLALNIRKIRFAGTYVDTYRALATLADSNIKALPVSLAMKAYDKGAGKQEWLLKLWL
ncbi:hypothetical protein [Methylobacter sp. BBA5.1]|uniref:hypothetical protein n=1 Tax=Methylobacter sp. BBA5.1 TaxID=1495064 RepID=UPI000568D5DD|nr:hypothetical protein [Methylobacter sp. BBA5.1]